MKKFVIIPFFLFCLTGVAQTISLTETPVATLELPEGLITGQVFTTDNQPAAFVTITLRGTNRATTTNGEGYFTLKGLKEGSHVLEITMTGLKSQEKTVVVKRDQPVSISITLAEDAQQLAAVIVSTRKSANERIVSIGKIAINPMDLPQSMTVVGQGLIREQQAQRLGDVIKNVNGVYITTTRGNVQESFGARGYGFGTNNLFKNGARVNAGAMPEMSSLEKIEVLKGSTAILFGQVAPGGIVNMVTKQPKFTQGGEIAMRAGSYNLFKPSFDIYGPISAAVAYRLNGTYETAGSYRDGVSSERFYANPSLLFKLGKKTELITEADYLYHNFTPDFGIGSLDGVKIPDVPRSRFMGAAWQYSKTQQATATATLNHQFNDNWKLATAASYQLYKRDYYGVERVQAAANGDWTRPLGKILTNENYYTGQVNLNGKFKTAFLEHTLLAGADADHYLTTNNDFSFPAVAGLPANSYDKINILDPEKFVQRTDIPTATAIRQRVAPVNRYGFYVQDLLKISSKLNVLAGIRWSYVQTKGIDSTNLLTKAKTTGKNKSDQAFSPRFGVVYKPSTTTSVFASYANSFVVNTGQDVEGNPVDPSLIDQYEVGVKNELLKGLLSANLTLYRIKNNNLAQTAPFLKDGTQNNNSGIKQLTGQTTSDGVEIDLSGEPLKGLSVTAGYSYNYMRYTKTDTTVGSFKNGERLVSNPAHTANGSVFYTIGNGKLTGLKAGITAAYVGERFGGWNTDVVRPAGATTYQYRSRLFEVGGFTTIDVTAGYTFKKLSLLAKVSNLNNALNYYVHENYSINPIAPRQFIATVAYKF